MRTFTATLIVASLSTGASAACPDYLNHDMRKLHSSASVNLCEVQGGGPMLIVNTASHCGYTSQFKGLEALHKAYGERGLRVVGFPSNDFRQAAKDEETAAEICYVNYGVTFTMLSTSHVKGDQANPVFRELARQTRSPNWNFNKYLVDGDGRVVQHFGSNTRPDSSAMKDAIEGLL